MLTVWCVCTGDKYNSGHVYALKRMVNKHLSERFVFKCVTEKTIHGVFCVKPKVLYKSWWDKFNLFWLANGPSIYFDLDVVITGNLDYLVAFTKHDLAAPANWGQSGHGGIQSSVMCWSGQIRPELSEDDIDRLHGDQCLLTEMYGDTYIKIPRVYSYKYHSRSHLPDDASVVCFHGKPDYWEVNHRWIDQALS
ncbi:MAG: hypothetical protein ACN2B6_00640 [Rickettsiales bacterium]